MTDTALEDDWLSNLVIYAALEDDWPSNLVTKFMIDAEVKDVIGRQIS